MPDNITVSIPQAWALAILGFFMTGSAVMPFFRVDPYEMRVYRLELRMDKHDAEALISKLDEMQPLNLDNQRVLQLEILKVQDISKELRDIK